MSADSCVVLVAGENLSGQPLYAYVVLPSDDFDAFMDARAEGTLAVEDYGTILEAGEGVASPELRRVIACEWGFHDGNELPVLDDALVEELVDSYRAGATP